MGSDREPTGADDGAAFDFPLVGERGYVRATEVLRQLGGRFPGAPLKLRFVRPLTGPSRLVARQGPQAAVSVEAAGRHLWLEPDPTAPAPRRLSEAEARAPRGLPLRLGNLFCFAFHRPAPFADHLERGFEFAHPRLGRQFIVRRVSLLPGATRTSRFLIIRVLPGALPDTAVLEIRTGHGPAAVIEFRLRARGDKLRPAPQPVR